MRGTEEKMDDCKGLPSEIRTEMGLEISPILSGMNRGRLQMYERCWEREVMYIGAIEVYFFCPKKKINSTRFSELQAIVLKYTKHGL